MSKAESTLRQELFEDVTGIIKAVSATQEKFQRSKHSVMANLIFESILYSLSALRLMVTEKQ